MLLSSSQTLKMGKQASGVNETHQFYKGKSIQQPDKQTITGAALNDEVNLPDDKSNETCLVKIFQTS